MGRSEGLTRQRNALVALKAARTFHGGSAGERAGRLEVGESLRVNRVLRRADFLDRQPEGQILQRSDITDARGLILGGHGHLLEPFVETESLTIAGHSKQSKPDGPKFGAYGIAFTGIDPSRGLLELDDPPASEPWHIVHEPGATLEPDEVVGVTVYGQFARIVHSAEAATSLDRAGRLVTFHTGDRLTDDAVVHPGLSGPAAVISYWAGRSAIHGAAVVVDGSAWVVLGSRGAGKSTTAGLIIEAGHHLLADDLAVIDGEDVLAGPASVDFREETAELLGGEPLGKIGSRDRWRRPTPVRHQRAPLAGFVDLAWEPSVTVDALGVGERIRILSECHLCPPRPDALLALSSLAMLRFGRPRHLKTASSGVDLLLEQLRLHERRSG